MSANRFPGTCTRCHRNVDAGKGTLTGKTGGRWAMVHTGRCDGSFDLEVDTSEAECIAAEFDGLDGWTDRFIARTLDACCGETGEAWALICEGNEWWDGERDLEEASRRNFDRIVALGPAVWASAREMAR